MTREGRGQVKDCRCFNEAEKPPVRSSELRRIGGCEDSWEEEWWKVAESESRVPYEFRKEE